MLWLHLPADFVNSFGDFEILHFFLEFVCHSNYNKNVFHMPHKTDVWFNSGLILFKFRINSFQQPQVFIFHFFYAFCILIITCMISMIFFKCCVSSQLYKEKKSWFMNDFTRISLRKNIFNVYFLFQVACRWKCKKNTRHR